MRTYTSWILCLAVLFWGCGDDDSPDGQDMGTQTLDLGTDSDAEVPDASGDATPDTNGSCDDDGVCASPGFCLFPPSPTCARPAGGGQCTPRPMRCRGIPVPLCGCDGQTYDNDCEARLAGVSVAHEGPCINEGCGPLGEDCGDDEFCDYDNSAMCGRVNTGQCLPRPAGCAGLPDRVCGCDGSEYESACLANISGVSVASAGSCATGAPCGGGMGIACPSGSLCRYAAGDACGASGGAGVCVSQPATCPASDQPVCGCDDQTYDSECHAWQAGVSVASLDTCDETGRCGGAGGRTCPDGQFCDFRPGAMCAGSGTCLTEPTDCEAIDFPVCGCDSLTYDNACLANAAGYSVQFDGACP